MGINLIGHLKERRDLPLGDLRNDIADEAFYALWLSALSGVLSIVIVWSAWAGWAGDTVEPYASVLGLLLILIGVCSAAIFAVRAVWLSAVYPSMLSCVFSSALVRGSDSVEDPGDLMDSAAWDQILALQAVVHRNSLSRREEMFQAARWLVWALPLTRYVSGVRHWEFALAIAAASSLSRRP